MYMNILLLLLLLFPFHFCFRFIIWLFHYFIGVNEINRIIYVNFTLTFLYFLCNVQYYVIILKVVFESNY
jgi:hypothetical protein